MAVIKQIYKDNITYEYRAGNNVKLQLNGITITVYKPYALKRYNNYVYTGPKITIAANPTAILNIQDLSAISDCVRFGIKLLNKEGINLIDVNNWTNDYNYVDSSKVQLPKLNNQQKHKWHKPEVNDVFSDGRGHYFIYLGIGDLVGYNKYDTRNLMNGRKLDVKNYNDYACTYCYIEVAEESIKNIRTNLNKVILEDSNSEIRSYKNLKKAYEIVEKLPRGINEYEFRAPNNSITEQYIMCKYGTNVDINSIRTALKNSRLEAGYKV